jgi:hypothetical protein
VDWIFDFDVPRKGDKLFVTDKEEGCNVLLRYSAGDTDAYSYGFDVAVEGIMEATERGSAEWDFLGLPVVYLCRHRIELRLKVLHAALQQAAGGSAAEPFGHDLAKLWNNLRPLIEQQYPAAATYESLDASEALVMELHVFDPRSTAVRYARNEHGKPTLDKTISFDPHHFVSKIGLLCSFLDGMISHLSE